MLTTQQAMTKSGLSRGQILRHIKFSRLPAIKTDDGWLIEESDLSSFLLKPSRPGGGRPKRPPAPHVDGLFTFEESCIALDIGDIGMRHVIDRGRIQFTKTNDYIYITKDEIERYKKEKFKRCPEAIERYKHLPRKPAEQRLFSHVDKKGPDECWNWRDAIDKDGYPRMLIWEGTKKRKINVSRVLYALEHGPVSDGLIVCHHCDNPRCCNPKHLFLGTTQDNVNDRQRKNRGHHHINPDDVRTIRLMYQSGTTREDLAELFDMTKTKILDIIIRRTWISIP